MRTSLTTGTAVVIAFIASSCGQSEPQGKFPSDYFSSSRTFISYDASGNPDPSFYYKIENSTLTGCNADQCVKVAELQPNSMPMADCMSGQQSEHTDPTTGEKFMGSYHVCISGQDMPINDGGPNVRSDSAGKKIPANTPYLMISSYYKDGTTAVGRVRLAIQ